MTKEIPQFTKNIFWDLKDSMQPDLDKYSKHVIEKVYLYGKLEDWYKLQDYYGIELIKDTIMNLRYLDPGQLYIASKLLNIAIQDFRVYKLHGGMPKHWAG
jgi:hypothetical protein